MALVWSSNKIDMKKANKKELKLNTSYYNDETRNAAFFYLQTFLSFFKFYSIKYSGNIFAPLKLGGIHWYRLTVASILNLSPHLNF